MDTHRAASFAAKTSLETLPKEVVERAKLHVWDVLGTMLSGLDTSAAQMARETAKEFGSRKEATLFGTRDKISCAAAAFANSIAASDLDWDDGHSRSGLHPAAPIIPAALAVSEFAEAPGKTLLEAVVAGYELATRAGLLFRASPNHPLPSGGRVPHGAGAAGTYGAATACAKVLGLNENGIFNAISIAGAHAPTSDSSKLPTTGAMTKEAIGWGGFTGVVSALLARRGFTGSLTIYDEEKTDKSCLETFGKTYEILNTYFKPYAACRVTHSGIDAILELRKKHSLKAENVSRIVVETHRGAAPLNSTRPTTIEQAQYSYPFCMAAALLEGAVGPQQIADSRLTDPRILQLADKVVVVHVPAFDGIYPNLYPNSVTVETKDGNKYQLRKDIGRGDPRNPLPEKDVKAKLDGALQRMSVSKDSAQRINESLEHLEKLPKVNLLIELLKS
ncbi:MAG: MmgE/PrpD family protein [Chloroflexi bacterium]|nr:MmgE/PrpD family protein [Chloroflexota bacterium]